MHLAKMVYMVKRSSLDSPSITRLWTLMLLWNLVTVRQATSDNGGVHVSSCPTNNNVFTNTGYSTALQYGTSSLLSTGMVYQVIDPGGATRIVFITGSGQLTVIDKTPDITVTGDTSTGDLSFRIDNIQTADIGVYKIVKTTEPDTPLLCNTVYITGSLSVPSMTVNNVYPSVGESVTLTCSSSSTTVPAGLLLIYTWHIGGTTNPSDSRYTYSTSRDTLTVSGIQKSDADKEFTCRAQEQDSQITSSSSSQLNIDVYYGPENVRVDPSSTSYIRTENTTLGPITCTADCNPTCTYTWTHLSNTWNSAILNLGQVSRTEAGVYRCTATRSSGNQGSVDLALKVHYCPDVSVTTTNVTTQVSSVDIVCNPSGVPDQYTFSHWTHQWDINGQVLNHPGLGNNPVLKLTNLKFSYSGVYTCRASNGIECSKNQNAGTGQIILLVKAAPVIIDPQSSSNDRIQVASKINSAAMVNIKFWSNAGNVDIRCFRIKDNTWLSSPEVEIVQTQTTVRLPVFSSYVSTTGTLALVSVWIKNKEEFGEYDIVLSNGIGVERRLKMLIVLQAQAVQEEVHVGAGTVVGSVIAVLVGIAVMIVAYIVHRRYTCIRRAENRTSKDVQMTERHKESSNETANPDHVYNDLQQTASEEPAAVRHGANIYEKPAAMSCQEHVYSDIKHDG